MSERNQSVAVADFEAEEGATPEQISAVISAAREQYVRQQKVERLEAELKEAKEEFRASAEVLVPKALAAAGMDIVPLGTPGFYAKLVSVVKANVPSPHSEKVEDAQLKNDRGTAYLDQVHPEIVKNKFTAYFPKGMEKLFRKFMRDMKQRKTPIEYEIERTVHTGSLTAWVKTQDALGKPVDEEALNVKRFKIAEIVVPKPVKPKDKLK